MSYLFLNVNLFSRKKEHVRGFIPILVIIAIALVAIPVTTVLVKQQQDNRQRAYFTEEGGGGGGKIGCPNPPPEGGTNSCVPSSWFSSCPGGSYPYGSPDGDSDCTAAASGESSMCCFTPPALIPTSPPSCTYGNCVNEGFKTSSSDPSGYYICLSGCNQYESCPANTTFNSSTKSCEGLQTCSQKYGTGYQCLTSFATECQSGTIQSTTGTDCVDSAGFDVSCCKAPPPTPTPSPTPTNAPLLTCSQKYGNGYQCLLSTASECQYGTIQNTTSTDCVDSAGFDVSCCKAAAPTTKVTGICPAGNADGSTNVCRPDGSSIGKSICPLGEEYVPDGNYCSAQNGGNDYVCCKKPVFQCAYNKGFCSLPTTCGKGYGPASNSTDCDAEGFTCCLPNPTYACEANGGRCINPLSTSCASTEEQYTEGASSCGVSNQVCCIPKKSPVALYCQIDGFRCNNDIIYDLFRGKRATPEDATVNCRDYGKVCSLTDGCISCLDKSVADEKNKISKNLYHAYCSENKIVSADFADKVLSPTNPNEYIIKPSLIEDCGSKYCTTINDAPLCSITQFDDEIKIPVRPPRVGEGEGINEGDNSNKFDKILAPQDEKYHKSDGASCKGNKLYPPVIFLGYDASGNAITKTSSVVDCAKINKVCTEIDQDVLCADPVIVNNQPVNHFYCGGRYDAPIDAGVSSVVTSALTNVVIGLVINKIKLVDLPLAAYLKTKPNIGLKDIKSGYMAFHKDDPEGYLEKKGIAITKDEITAPLKNELLKAGLNSEVAKKISLGFEKDIAKKVAGYIGAEPIILFLSPDDIALFISTSIDVISYHVLGLKYDYWTCQGDKLLKSRIDVTEGKSDDQVRDCQPEGTSCKLFDEWCVVCVKKQVLGAYSSVKGITDSCTLKGQGDANCDGKVNNTDLLLWRKERLSGKGTSGDFNRDGKVNDNDIDYFIPKKY